MEVSVVTGSGGEPTARWSMLSPLTTVAMLHLMRADEPLADEQEQAWA
jgi:hypothetical protein